MDRKIKVLFVIKSAHHFYYYRSIIKEFCRRGHEIVVLFDKELSSNANWDPVNSLQEKIRFKTSWLVRRNDLWRSLLFQFREIRSHRRLYLMDSPLHRNWRRYTPFWFRAVTKLPGVYFFVKLNVFDKFLKWFERIAPPSKHVTDHIKSYSPDVVVAGPTNLQQSEELEYIKAAKALNISTVIPVLSWDNLNTKGVLNILPDRLLVWNNAHMQDAIKYQGVPKGIIRIVGSFFFDTWFSDLKPTSRQDFCKKYGLNKDHLIILYLGSSRNMAKDETYLIESLRQSLDGSDNAKLRNAQIIMRPHGANFKIYKDLSIRDTIVLPKEGTVPNTPEALQLFYDSMYHAIAVVGINTTAMIDAIINRKPVIVNKPKGYSLVQEGLEYFKKLMDSKSVDIVESSEECVKELKNILQGVDKTRSDREVFVKEFVRPYGLDISAGEVAVNEVEKVVSQK